MPHITHIRNKKFKTSKTTEIGLQRSTPICLAILGAQR